MCVWVHGDKYGLWCVCVCAHMYIWSYLCIYGATYEVWCVCMCGGYVWGVHVSTYIGTCGRWCMCLGDTHMHAYICVYMCGAMYGLWYLCACVSHLLRRSGSGWALWMYVLWSETQPRVLALFHARDGHSHTSPRRKRTDRASVGKSPWGGLGECSRAVGHSGLVQQPSTPIQVSNLGMGPGSEGQWPGLREFRHPDRQWPTSLNSFAWL
jgi:hypothetical protein